MNDYDNYVAGKIIESKASGFDPVDLNPKLFPYQADIVRWAIRRGKAALFEAPGLGKSFQEWEFAKHTSEYTDMPAIIFAPLSVSEQMVMEAPEFGYTLNLCRTRGDIRSGINVTNYEKLDKFSAEDFGTVVIDESSLLKAGSFGKTATMLKDFASTIPFRLAATATPSPNDMDEILYHAEWLGVMREAEAKALFFTQDGNSSNKMRLKMNAVDAFYKWLASWSIALRQPSDLGYSNDGFQRPPVNYTQITVDVEDPHLSGTLFQMEARGIDEQRKARNATMVQRVQAVADLVNSSNEQWLVWCDLNTESDALRKAIPGSVEVKGADSPEHKVDAMVGFKSGKYRVVVSKPSMWGFGLNLQHSHNMAFCGLGNSFEQYLQAIARQDRFGQKHTVNVFVVVSIADGAVVENIKRKWVQHDKMYEELIKHVTVYTDLQAGRRQEMDYDASQDLSVPSWLSPSTNTNTEPGWSWIDLDSIFFQWTEAPSFELGTECGNEIMSQPEWIKEVV